MYKTTYRDPSSGIIHIVAMPSSTQPFTACGTLRFEYTSSYARRDFKLGVATCLSCWAREFIEWEHEASWKGFT